MQNTKTKSLVASTRSRFTKNSLSPLYGKERPVLIWERPTSGWKTQAKPIFNGGNTCRKRITYKGVPVMELPFKGLNEFKNVINSLKANDNTFVNYTKDFVLFVIEEELISRKRHFNTENTFISVIEKTDIFKENTNLYSKFLVAKNLKNKTMFKNIGRTYYNLEK